MSRFPVFPRVPDPLRFWRRVTPDRVALVDRARDARFTYAELDAAADRWAGLLRSSGVGPGARVVALAGNRREMVELFFACGRIGAALVPMNWRLAPSELAPVIDDAQPSLLVGEERFRSVAEMAIHQTGSHSPAAVRWVDLDHDVPALLRNGEPHAGGTEVAPDDPHLILYTSGSTGCPKGAIIPHRQIFYNAVATATAWELGSDDIAPVSTPLFHTGGWNVFATPLWHRGGRVVLFDSFDPTEFLQGLAEEGCTMALTVPTQLLMLSESSAWGRELPALRYFVSGGAPCPAALAERVRAAGHRFREGYGLTECGPNCFAISEVEAERRPGSVGWPVPFLEMRLVGTDGGDVERGDVGELWLRGPQMFAGYLNNEERTSEALGEGGWLCTGDLARQDQDGAFMICGRSKEMYISGGENVFPGEVEAALADCPGVAEVVVVGVPDARWGETGRAFVVPRQDVSLSETDILTHSRARLAGYKVPRSVVFLDAIPRLGSGKPDRRVLLARSREIHE
jgi:fatty-acyl-CoA synthase